MTCETGWTVSYSAKRWHTFSCDSVWLLATNPKILVGEGSLHEGQDQVGEGNSAHSAPPCPFSNQVAPAPHYHGRGYVPASPLGLGDPRVQDLSFPHFEWGSLNRASVSLIRVRKARMCLGHQTGASPQMKAPPPCQAGGFLRTRAQLLPHVASRALPQGDCPGGWEGLTRRACGTSATCGKEAWTAVGAEALLHSTALWLSSWENGELCPQPRHAPPPLLLLLLAS